MKYLVGTGLALALLYGERATASEDVAQADSPISEEYIFSPELFRGGRFSQTTLAQLTRKGSVAAGSYRLDVYVNGRFVDAFPVEFVAGSDGKTTPCFLPSFFQQAGIALDEAIAEKAAAQKRCLRFKEQVKGGDVDVNLAQLRLNVSVPQIALRRAPRGYVSPAELDTGSSMAFVNYLGNYYHVSYSDGASRSQDSAWISLNGGINLADWQFRQLSNMTWTRDAGYRWNALRSYVQKPLPALRSQMTAGELITSGRFFSGLNYKGVSLATDDRMLPDSMRGYAPTIAGIAVTNAKVSVRQNGQEIYQTTVAPGAFEINDLYPTSYSGDLQVEVTEADGTVRSFSVPFSAVPESMRPGISRFNLETGKTRDSGDESWFGDLSWQRGLSNALTFNSGLRLADAYRAAMLGGVYGSSFGALGMDMTWSHAGLADGETTQGWMTHLAWSKTFQQTMTTVSLAGYRYSTRGYRDLSDVLGARRMAKSAGEWRSDTSSQRSRFDISLSQSLQDVGNLFVTGSVQEYRDGRSRDTQLQLGYSMTLPYGIGMNLSLGRQRSGSYGSRGAMQTMSSLSFSIPLGGETARRPTLSTSWTRASGGGSQLQSSLSGILDEQQTASYGINVSHDRQHRQTVYSGNLQKRMQNTSLGFNASRGQGYWQASGNAQGAAALHAGGVTFGQYLSDTFALVEAKGAEGARVFNAGQVTINDSGYALVPSITPYRYNRITLDPQNMSGSAELVDSEKRVAPVAGAASKVVFRTRSGTALLIKTRLADGSPVPLGADVLDEAGRTVGMAGQGGQIYLRSEKARGRFTVRWGETARERCALPFDLTGTDLRQPMIRLSATCVPEKELSQQ
ncbi:fimbria/pilus outer membrane usher protein [uncultured Pluralibacter sp.]|uniref:fimbria/pilus outer membrane usher protein n=1 Tax=uncultured Pluralibacter sp. TaxID=1490864 RepID=UPI0026384FF6|nr:fimbria/pilus outer membrane usher protein [uncultured Pluralibacter sp.]